MVPADLVSYFTTMATVGGTLVGLIFIAISIFPETTIEEKAPLDRQARVASSFTALLNPMIISLFALIPHQTIGDTTAIVAAIDLLTHVSISIYLLRQRSSIINSFSRAIFIIGGFVMYIYEVDAGIRLLQGPGDASAMETLNVLLIIIYIYGISRAWEVLGARQFNPQAWIKELVTAQVKHHQDENDTSTVKKSSE